VVVFTGMKTAIGRVQKEVLEAAEEEEDTPLKQKLDDFGEKLSYLIGAVCFIVWIMNYKNFWDEIHGSPIKGCIYYFKIAIALAVAAIPEGLPAVITTCLALGTRKMAQNNAVVRRLPSVETLGCTTIICSDKTGTLTKNEMCAVKFGVLLDGTAKLSIFDIDEAKNSYSPVNCYIKSSTRDFEADRAKNPDLFTSLATVCTYNNSSRVEVEGNNFKRVGEPTEAALKVFAEKLCGSAVDAKNAFNFEKQIGSKLTSIATLDFTSERKAMSTLVSGYKGNVDLLIKGAPDRIVNKCSNMLSKDGSRAFQGSEKAELLKQIGELAGKGLRCLAIAEMQP
jgi:magnesium-transporting ATPase (P-type)